MSFKANAVIILLTVLLSCRSEQSLDSVVLQVILPKDKTEHLIHKYVYLEDVFKRSAIDSVVVKGDTVTFTERYTPNFYPYMVAVEAIDTFEGHPYRRPVGLQNPYDANAVYSSFYLDKGETILRPYFTGSTNEECDFIGSKQNEPYFKRVELQYAEENSVNKHVIIEKNVSKIKSYPYSIHLLNQLFKYKDKFSNEDLKNQLSIFDDDVKRTPLFKNFTNYFTTSSTFDKAYPLIKMENQNGKYEEIGSNSATYNLIIYWASWCGPCRKEIPEIKELNNKFVSKGLSITSISIDEEKQNWQTALKQEKMSWQQLIAIDSTKTFLDLHYDIKAIPKAYLFNKKKDLIKTFDDGDGRAMANYINSLFQAIN